MATAMKRADPVPGYWVEHRIASWLLRVSVLLAPVLAGAAASVAVGRAFERPGGLGELAWWAMVLGVSAVTVVIVERLARTLLPLAALLRLSLIFPDKAPSRFSVAMRTLNVRRLQAWAHEVNEDGSPVDVAERATSVLSLAAALNVHDRRTRGHSERVRALTALVAEEMGLDEHTTSRLLWGALLHDIGKLAVPQDILNKPGAPDAKEWKVLARHPIEGERIAGALEGWLGAELAAIGEHHEKWDGSGYPHGLAGEDIALAARIVALTDAFETMTALRSYKTPVSVETARAELVDCSGTHFDPKVVRAFVNISIGRLHWSVGVASWFAQLPFLGVIPRAGAQVATLTSGSAAYGTAVAGVALVVGSALSGVGSPTPTAGASVTSGPAVTTGWAFAPGGGSSDSGGGSGDSATSHHDGGAGPGGALGNGADTGGPGGGTPGGAPGGGGGGSPSPPAPPPPPPPPSSTSKSNGGGRPFEIPPGHTSPKPPGPSNADGNPGRETLPVPVSVPGNGNPGGGNAH